MSEPKSRYLSLIIIGAEAILAFAGLFILINTLVYDHSSMGRNEMTSALYLPVGYLALIAGMIIFSAFHKEMYHVLFAIEMLPFIPAFFMAMPTLLHPDNDSASVGFKSLIILFSVLVILPHALYYGALIRIGKQKKVGGVNE